MHQGRGLERLAGWLVCHLVRGQLAKFLINDGEQLVGGLGFALLYAIKDARDVAHGLRLARIFHEVIGFLNGVSQGLKDPGSGPHISCTSSCWSPDPGKGKERRGGE